MVQQLKMVGRSRHRRLGKVELLLMMVDLHSHLRILQKVLGQEQVQEKGQGLQLRRCTTSVASDKGWFSGLFNFNFEAI